MLLKLLGSNNFEISTTYDILLSDESSNYVLGSNEWINADFAKKNLVYKIDMVIFEEIFDKILKNFSYYDCYDITEFQESESEKFLYLLEQERQINGSLNDRELRQKYEFIFESVKNQEEFLLAYDTEKLDEFIREDVDTILSTFIQSLKASVNENKTLTIVGI